MQELHCPAKTEQKLALGGSHSANTLALLFCFSTFSLEPLHRFASNFGWMFLGWTPTKFVKVVVLPLFVWNYG